MKLKALFLGLLLTLALPLSAAETKITYGADTAVTVTLWTTSLLTQESATSAIIDNTSNLCVDILVGGEIAADTTTGTMLAGESFDIYIGALYDKDTTTTAGGSIGTSMDPGTPAEEVVSTDFVRENMILFHSVQLEAATPDTTQDYVFNPKGIAQFFGGVLPQKVFFLLHNNTGASLGSGSALNSVCVTYTTV